MPQCLAPMRAGLTIFSLLAFLTVSSSAADLGGSEKALMQGRAADAVSSLRAAISANPKDARAHLLLCRVFYTEQLADQAVNECEASVALNANSSEAQDWMGRAYGMKADHAGPFSGYSLAKKAKAAWETAVNLNPANSEAVDDLGEYYVRAPGIVGGGVDKAAALADRVQTRLPDRALRIRALIAEKQKDDATAERNFRACVETTGGRADTWVELGSFYGRHQDTAKARDAFQHSFTANRVKDASLVHLAQALIGFNLDSALAERALRDYLSGNNWSDSAPTFEAHTLLAKLLANKGDKNGARAELDKALSLAPDYTPAKKALASL